MLPISSLKCRLEQYRGYTTNVKETILKQHPGRRKKVKDIRLLKIQREK